MLLRAEYQVPGSPGSCARGLLGPAEKVQAWQGMHWEGSQEGRRPTGKGQGKCRDEGGSFFGHYKVLVRSWPTGNTREH